MKSRIVVFSFAIIALILYALGMPSALAWKPLSSAKAVSASSNPFNLSIPNLSANGVWIAPSAPLQLRQLVQSWGLPAATDRASASMRLDIANAGQQGAEWVYALVAPFPTITDDVSFTEVLSSWKGHKSGPFAGRPLIMDDSARTAFTQLWGAPAAGAVQSVPAGSVLEAAWYQRPSWAIVPFEELDPHWKVLTIDGQSPIHNDFKTGGERLMGAALGYPLIVRFALSCAWPCNTPALPDLPASNRDPDKLTTLVMTGVTAFVRATAFVMNTKGITLPGRDIHDWLADADITHISNEVPFAGNCPAPSPDMGRLVFCSDPRYMDLLRYIGADVIELTGNHYADYGAEAMQLTLKMYAEAGMGHFGGGANLEDARRPLLVENHGNHIAFIGCNQPDVGRVPTATESRPGAAPCDYPYMTDQIRRLHGNGYIVITTFQYYESYSPTPFEAQVRDFHLMADAGADIVQGSQAHNPESLEFDGNSLIHYGLGNLFFDQMGNAGNPTRQEFIDRHVFYDGRYISTELLTAELEDYSRPRPMTPQERAVFLTKYFAASGW